MWDLAPHDLSIMLYLTGQRPRTLSAIGARPFGFSAQESVAFLTLHFDDGMLAHFHLSWLSPLKMRRTILAGQKKMVVYDHLDPDNQVKVYDKGVEVRSDLEKDQLLIQYRIGDMYAPKVDQSEALEIEARHFLDCVTNGEKPITDGAAGLEVVRLLEAAQHSMANSGESVRL